MNDIVVEVKIKERTGHLVKTDNFKGSPERVVNILMQKYVGYNGYERLGNLILDEIKNG